MSVIKIYLRFVSLFMLLSFITGLPAETAFAETKAPVVRTKNQLVPRQLPVKPLTVEISPTAELSHVVVKFRDESSVRYRGGQISSVGQYSIKNLKAILDFHIASRSFKRLFQSKGELALDRERTALQLTSGHQLADLNNYYRIDVTSHAEAAQLVDNLNKLEIVEIAYLQPAPSPAGDIAPPTPDYVANQDYLEAAPAGVDAVYANGIAGGDGSGVRIIDIEGGWKRTHEDLDKAVGGLLTPFEYTDPSWRNHGTAVIGELIAGDNGYGVTGICPGADIWMVSIAGISTADALYLAIDSLNQGDIILIELHAPGPHYNFEVRSDQLGYVCMEYWQANYDAIQYAWAKGIVVIEAAGNGAENFDDASIYGQLFDTTWRNSHAIIVGAGYPAASANNLQRHGFSNYGERVNLQGYGSGVYTTGYGSLFDGGGDENQYYTASFSGTSSASPIVTGAATCLQGYSLANFGVAMSVDEIRSLLVSTGTNQLGNTAEHIGPRPNLQAAFGAYSGPPSIYVSPIYIDTLIDEGTTATLPVWMFNRSSSLSMDFQIIDNDSLARMVPANWLTASPSSGTILPSDSTLITVQLDATVLVDRVETYTGQLEINWGSSGSPLDSVSLVPVFLDIPCNDTTYIAVSSDDLGGPTYNWISAKDSGFVIQNWQYYGTGSNPLDDGTTGPHQIGFDFPYYDTSYSELFIGVNGAISFTDTNLNLNGFYSSLDLPGAPFETFVAPFWADLIFDTALVSEGAIYLYRSPSLDTFVIEWYRPANFNQFGDTTLNFELIFTWDGNIIAQYRNLGTSSLEQIALIGVSEVGCRALSHVDAGDIPANVVTTSESVLFYNSGYVWAQAGDMDGLVDITVNDLTYLVRYLFQGGPDPIPIGAGNVDCIADIDVNDLTALVAYLFQGGDEPCWYLQ